MRRREFLAAPLLQTSKTAKRPNVIMFMTDDHGAWANGCYGCGEIQTPNVDGLASGGARFTRAYAATPVCSPSRMTWMTGRLPSTHGVQDWLRPVDSFEKNSHKWLDGHTTYAELLAQSGYTLGLSGKWHMGDDHLAQKGFSYWATVPGGGGPYKDQEFVVNGQKVKTSGYKTDRVGDFALDFLDKQRNATNPFYLLVPFYAPHTPFDYQPAEYRAPYENATFQCFPRVDRHAWQNAGYHRHHLNTESMRAYASLITGMDANVGRVVRRIEEMGQRENTLIVFTADQGWNAGHHGVWGKGNGTWPFNMYEESIRVPLIWNHPGRVKSATTPDQMVSSYDYFPTILDYLGVRAPKDSKRPGRSYASVLAGRNLRWDNRLFFEYSMVRGVRTENLKLIRRTKEWESEFYDLEADPGETRNQVNAAEHRGQISALDKELGRFFGRIGAPGLENWRSTTKQELTVYSR